MDRRKNIKYLLSGTAGLVCGSFISQKHLYANYNDSWGGGLDYIFLNLKKSAHEPIPDTTRVPFGWSTFSVGDKNNSSFLEIPDSDVGRLRNRSLKLRFSVALDSRENHTLIVEIPNENIKLGEIEIRFSPVLQYYECNILPVYLKKIQTNGIEIYLSDKSGSKLWLFNESRDKEGSGLLFQPHIMAFKKKRVSKRYFFDNLFSENSLQPFGWMEGCILDALWQLNQHKTFTGVSYVIDKHINRYFNSTGELTFEDSRSFISDNKLKTIEETLPFAILAQYNPNHPYLEKVIDFWNENKKRNGLIIDGESITAEGNYTVAYPMAVLGKLWNREDLMVLSLEQIRKRKSRLIYNEDLYLRYFPEDKRTYKNWSRGVAWYMLGLVRTLNVLYDRSDIDDLKSEFERIAKKVLTFQRRDGLWGCFLHDSDSKPDTSGSAGIAAAIAAGCATGLLPHFFSTKAERTWEGLMVHLTPDGLLTGVAQSNRGGEELQKSDYRVISPMGMGLMGQLYAYL